MSVDQTPTGAGEAPSDGSGDADRTAPMRAVVVNEPTNINLELTLGPLSNALGDVAGLLAESCQSLLAMFYPVPIAKRANVVVTELVQNVFENIVEPTSSFTMRLGIDGNVLRISVTNSVKPEHYEKVQARISALRDPGEAKKLLAKTIRERRPQRLKGGLGLIRLVAENRFALSTEYTDGRLTVNAEHVVKVSA